MKLGVVVAFAAWGYSLGTSVLTRLVLGLLSPLVGFGLWGGVDFRGRRHAEVLRCVEELTITAVAAAGWYVVGRHVLGVALLTLSIAYHAAIYATGQRLLKPTQV